MKRNFLSFIAILLLCSFASAKVVPGEFIIKYKSGTPLEALNTVKSNSRTAKIKWMHHRRSVLRVKVSTSAEEQSLLSDPDIEYAEPNYTVNVEPVESSNSASTMAAQTQVADSWLIEKSLAEASVQTVAVIDSGVDALHPLFVSAQGIWINEKEKNGRAGIDDDGNGYVDDINGWNFLGDSNQVADDNSHGTHVAGIVLSAGQDIYAEFPESSKIKVMPLKFLNSEGSGTTAAAIEAIYYAVDNGAAVINNSWGGSNYSKALQDAIEYANSKGVVVVSAAGNFGRDNDDFSMFPANYFLSNNISVLASANDDSKAGFSNYGLKSVSVAAPGVSVVSTVPGSCPGGCYKSMSGTSMAAPFVAGMAGLIKREIPNASAAQIKNIIINGAVQIPALSGTSVSGARVNVLNSILEAQNETPEEYVKPAASANPTSLSSGGGSGGAGCALVSAKALAKNRNGKVQDRNNVLSVFLLLLIPLLTAFSFRRRLAPVRS